MSISITWTKARVSQWGGGSDLRYWEPQRKVFASRYRFVAYSHLFHGTGPWPAKGDYSAEAHMTDLVAIMRRLETGPVHLVGFSTAIALRATRCEAGLVRSLTIIEPNVPWRPVRGGVAPKQASKPAAGGGQGNHPLAWSLK